MNFSQAKKWREENEVTFEVQPFLRKGSSELGKKTVVDRKGIVASAEGDGEESLRLATRRLKYRLRQLEEVEMKWKQRERERALEAVERKGRKKVSKKSKG